MANLIKKPDITELYIKHKELGMLLKRYEILNKEYINIVYNKKSSRQDIDNLNAELKTVNEKLIQMSKDIQILSNKLKPNNTKHQESIRKINERIERLIPMLSNKKFEFRKNEDDLNDIIGQEHDSKIIEESSNLKYIVLFILMIIIIVILIKSLLNPNETSVEFFIFVLILIVVIYQIVIWFLNKFT